jgi:hypothetical protein
MSFLYPVFFVGALAVAIPIVLHLLRRDVAPEVPFSAVRLLRRAPVERSRRRRLRDVLLLAARISALLLLVAAFARPYAAGDRSSGTRVIAIDRSFSIGAPGQFERALEVARQAIDETGGTKRVAVIAFDERADLVAPPGSASDARAALDDLAPGFGATRYAPLMEKAVATAEGGGTLVVISDLQRAGWDGAQPVSLPAGWRVDVRAVGAAPGNLAVSALAVEPKGVTATIRNAWNETKDGRVRLLHDGREIATSPFRVAPQSAADVAISASLPGSGALSVALDDPGGLAADDTRYLAAGGSSQPRALIVGSDTGGRRSGLYLARALETPADDIGFAVDVTTGAALSRRSIEDLAGHAVIVLLSTRGLDRRAREALAAYARRGGGLLLAAAPDLESAVLSTVFAWQPPLTVSTLEGTSLSFGATDPRHPIFRPFGPLLANLGHARFDRAWRLIAPGWNVLARFSDGSPALLERTEGAGRVVLFASDFDRRWNDFPVHPAFVPFAIEIARHTAGGRQATPDFTPANAPAGSDGRPGVYTIQPENRTVVLNVDPRESDPTVLSVDEFRGMVKHSEGAPAPATPLQAQQIEAAQSYWRYGLVLMLAALVAESFIGKAEGGTTKGEKGRLKGEG